MSSDNCLPTTAGPWPGTSPRLSAPTSSGAWSRAVRELMGRGSLPERIVLLRRLGPHAAGTNLTWSEADLCYLPTTNAWVLPADAVRRNGGLWRAADQQSCACSRAARPQTVCALVSGT